MIKTSFKCFFLRRIASFEIKKKEITNLKLIIEYCNLIVISVELEHNVEKGLLKVGIFWDILSFSGIFIKKKEKRKE